MTESFNNKHSIKMQLIFSDAQFWEIFFRLLIPNLSQNLEQEFLRFLNVGKNFRFFRSFLHHRRLSSKKYKSYEKKESLLITPNFLPSESVLAQIKNLQLGEALIYENEVLAARLNMENFSLSQIEK